MNTVFHLLSPMYSQPLYDHFARGGGGGSSGGGGSGGGGGVGGVAMIGFIPAHAITSWVNKHISRPVAIAVGCIVTVVMTVFIWFLSPDFAIIIGIGAACGVYSGANNFITRMRRKIIANKKFIQYAARTDPVWQEQALQTRISDVFKTFQADWSNFNTENMRTYMSPKYFEHNRLMMKALQQMGRRNEVRGPVIESSEIIDIIDDRNNDQDNFTADIQARAHDVLIDTIADEEIYHDDSYFEEYWNFDRQNDVWMLNGIAQATENQSMVQNSLGGFAMVQGMYYSADMGWLLLPKRGQLFGRANFKRSDINNHVIGEWGGLVVQLYTYIPFKAHQRADNYLIGQINLPKSYGGIIIKRKNYRWWFDRTPSGYQKVSMEWPDFNNRYSVYATGMDKVTSFELLNPAVMADIYDRNLPVSIEVVDNLVYIYCRVSSADKRYADMLEILRRAYKELQR